MLFSVVVPVYNVEKYIEGCINSVLCQNFVDYEIVLVNDGSTDLSKSICEIYEKKYSNIRLINKENGGLSDARNFGIKAATGDYIVFLDSDDELANANSLDSLRKAIENSRYPDVIVSRRIDYDEITLKEEECKYWLSSDTKLDGSDLLDYLSVLKYFYSSAWSFTVNRQYLISNDLFFYKGIYHEDEEWSPRCIINLNTYGFNNELLVKYRINREGSIIASSNSKKIFDKILIVDRLIEKSKLFDDNKKQKSFFQRAIMLYTIVLFDLLKYKNYSEYNSILAEVKKREYLLSKSRKRKHIIFYYVCRLIGIEHGARFLCRMYGVKI